MGYIEVCFLIAVVLIVVESIATIIKCRETEKQVKAMNAKTEHIDTIIGLVSFRLSSLEDRVNRIHGRDDDETDGKADS